MNGQIRREHPLQLRRFVSLTVSETILCCRLVAEYMEAAPATAVADAVEMLAGPNLLHMVHSHHGATAACQVLAMATAKQRKKVVKAMKGSDLEQAFIQLFVDRQMDLKYTAHAVSLW